MFKLLRCYWTVLWRPSRYFSLGFLTIVGFMAGVVFWGGFNTAMEMTNTETFCIGCHEMRDNVYKELQRTIHFNNRSGVRAICSDCHVPHEWTAKIARKMQASKELWGKIFGTIDTRGEIPRHAPRAGAARMEADEGQRLARMPQLPRVRRHGLHPPEPARRASALHAILLDRRARPASTATRASRTSCPT